MEFKIEFNNPNCWEDIVTINIDADDKDDALQEALSKNPEFSTWNINVKNG